MSDHFWRKGEREPGWTIADEVYTLRSHVSRLEESLRVALEERAEAVEVLRKVEWDGALDEFVCPDCSQTRPNHFHDCRLARAIGKGE